MSKLRTQFVWIIILSKEKIVKLKFYTIFDDFSQ